MLPRCHDEERCWTLGSFTSASVRPVKCYPAPAHGKELRGDRRRPVDDTSELVWAYLLELAPFRVATKEPQGDVIEVLSHQAD